MMKMNTLGLSFVAFIVGVFLWSGCGPDADVEAPTLNIDAQPQQTYTAGEDVIYIHMTATDPQDMRLEFEAVSIPSRASFETYQNEAVFNWDPMISDVTDGEPHRLVFSVTNEAGLSAERTVDIYIEYGQGGTKFLNSSSQLYNPASGEPIAFDVRVRHDQEPLVILSMPDDGHPEGATFEQIGDFEGRFEWMPSPAQRDRRIHTVVFEADDSHEIVEQEVTIVFQNPDGGQNPTNGGAQACEGDSPIDHEVLSAQRGAGAYTVEGSVATGDVDWEDALLYWTFDDPLGADPEFDSEVLAIEGGQFSGAIPNPLLDGGESVEISYMICVFGDDGDEGIQCLPSEFYYRFVAYAPDDDKCRDDGLDMTSPDRAGEISMVAWEQYRVCQESPKFHSLELFDGESAEVALSYSADLSPGIDVTFNGQPVSVDDYPCTGYAHAFVDGPGTVVVEVEADDFPYHITAYVDGGECPGQEYEPNDTAQDATLVTDDFKIYDNMAICTEEDVDVFAIDLVRDDQFDALLAFEHEQGDLDMTLFAPSQVDDVGDQGFGVAQGWSATNDETIEYQAQESGFYYLAVMTATTPNTYELMMARYCNVDDAFAGNHSQNLSAPLSIDEYEGLKLCENQSDWFQYSNDGSDDIWLWVEARIDYESGSAPLEMTIYDDQGDLLEEGQQMGQITDALVELSPGQWIDIEMHSSQTMIYDLEVSELD